MKTKRQSVLKVGVIEEGKIVQLNVDLPNATRDGFKMAAIVTGKPLKHWALEVLTNAAREQLKEKGIPANFELASTVTM